MWAGRGAARAGGPPRRPRRLAGPRRQGSAGSGMARPAPGDYRKKTGLHV